MGHGVFLRACAVIALVGSVARTSSAAEESNESEGRPSHRFAFTPSYAHAFVGRSVSHDALGLAAELHLGRRIGFALVGALYAPFDGGASGSTDRRTETLGTLVGEIRIALVRSERVDLSVVGGPGIVSMRPVSIVDPVSRTFHRSEHLAFSGGAVARIFLLPELALALEARHLMYVAPHESASIDESARHDPATWYGERILTNAVETRLGLAMFFSER